MSRPLCLLMLCLLPFAVDIQAQTHRRAERPVPRLQTLASRCHSAMDGASN